MTFAPINDDHAVQSVSFSIVFEKPLDPELISHFHANHERWLPDLPAVRTPQVFSFEIGPGNAEPTRAVGNGLEFSFLRPDGSPAWLFRCDANAIHVECTRYTRWERVWASAKKHLLAALALISEHPQASEMRVVAATLQYLDRFVGVQSENNFNSLFVENPFLAQAIFDLGDAWHSHTGWFDKSIEIGKTLNNLNVDAKTEIINGEPRISVGVMHLQQFRYTEASHPKVFFDGQETFLEGLMQTMHNSNKDLITSLLATDMGEKIGIINTENGS